MTQLFGYFFPAAPRDDLAGYSRYAAAAAGSTAGAASPAPANAACGGPHRRTANGLLIAMRGRPMWRGRPFEEQRSEEMLADIERAYRDRQADLLRDLDGPFAIAIVDAQEQSVLLAIDHIGIERMAYAQCGQGLVFGTSAASVSGFPGLARELRDQALYDFLFLHMVPAPDTVYAGVHKLPAATTLSYDGGACRKRRYWQPTYEYLRDFAELQSCLRTSLADAVRASGLDRHTGAFLSGGLDSSSVAGTLAGQSDQPAKTFSVGFGETSYDELQFARTANRHFGCQAFEYQLTPQDIVDTFQRIATSYDEPFGNSSAVPTFFCAKLAADNGVNHLLAGDGGDELFGGNERYAKQRIFELYRHVPGWFRRNVLEPLMRPVDAENGLLPLRKLKSYMQQASIPLPDRFESWNFVFREGRSRLLDADFAHAIDIEGPLKGMREVWSQAPSEQPLERMLWFDWQLTLADSDLPKVNTMCELAGIRVSYPMLHPAVVELSTRVPPSMKMKGLELRTFFKRAMRGFLPDEVLSKEKHGFGLPFGEWLKTDRLLGELIYSLLSDLKKRNIVSARFLNELIEEHRAGHASYYGYVIWDLAVLEAWLAHSAAGSQKAAPAAQTAP